MALRVGSVGLWSEAAGRDAGWWMPALWVGRSRTVERPAVDGYSLSSSEVSRQATNNRLRTGTDKGNPTV